MLCLKFSAFENDWQEKTYEYRRFVIEVEHSLLH